MSTRFQRSLFPLYTRTTVVLALCLLLTWGGPRAQAQVPADLAVQVSATVQASPLPKIKLSWPGDPNATSYQVYRKGRDDTSWGLPTPLPGPTMGYTDLTVSVGQAYEYQIIRKDPNYYEATGYIYSGINVPMTDTRGTVILVVEQSMAAPLAAELTRLQQDLVGDGWAVIRHDVGRDQNLSDAAHEPNDRGAGASALKAQIMADYNNDKANVKAVFLFGHVPIAYSGDLYPDGHPPHEGAWPADVYYGDVNGTWTDTQSFPGTYNTTASANTAGDGSFDQTYIPAPVTLAVGRVDLFAEGAPNGAYAPKTETDLLRQYLVKDHAFRVAQVTARRRGLADSSFGYRGFGDTFGDNAYRNFAPFFGASDITDISGNTTTWLPTLDADSYLWAEGDGAGAPDGSQGIANVGHGDGYVVLFGNPTGDYGLHAPKAIFNMLFGSFFGDWTYGNFYTQYTQTEAEINGNTDNLLRAPLCNGYGLTDVWAGRPDWFFHHMALGETIGFSTLITQNNGLSNLYQPQNYGTGFIHVALMGDPTLRMHMVAPATNLTAPIAGSAQVHWTASADPAVSGYHVYRAATANGPFTRLTTAPVTGTTFFDTTAQPGNSYSYMVRALKLETSGSGTYFNLSQGAFLTVTVTPLLFTSVSVGPTSVVGGVDATGTVTLNQPAPSGGIVVALSSGDGAASVPANVTVPEGSTAATFTVTTTPVSAARTVTLTASYNGVSQNTMLTVQPLTVVSVSFNPASVVEGSASTGTVTLNGPAPNGGATVSLSSDAAAVPVPPAVVVAAGSATATFRVATGPASAATDGHVAAGLNNVTQAGALTVTPNQVAGLALAPSHVLGGNSSTATVTLIGPAPVGGLNVTLSSSDPSASGPASVTVLQGSVSATFTVSTLEVARAATATLAASLRGAAQTASLTVSPYVVTGLALTPARVTAGSPTAGTITLNGVAPAGGLPVTLSSGSGAAAVPPRVVVPAGHVTATFSAATRAVAVVTAATLRAGAPGGAQTAVLTVQPNALVSLSLNPASAPAGAVVLGQVTLDGAAPEGGQTVVLSSADSSLVPVPVTVTVPAGQTFVTFRIPVGSVVGTASVKITASESGTSQATTLTVQGVTLAALAFDSVQVRAGQSASGAITLSGPAPPGGATVSLTSANPAVSVPATVGVPAGANSARFSAGTSAVSAAVTVSVTGRAGGGSATSQLTVVPIPGTVFGAGIRMISVPMDFPGVPVDQVLGAGLKLYRWMPSVLAYAVMPSAPADEVRLGHGYWLHSAGGVNVTRRGAPAGTTQDFPIPLEKGWNQIGDPFFSSVALTTLRVVAGDRTLGFGESGAPTDSPVYVYNPPAAGAPGQYQPAATLDPGQGYWIHVSATATLIVPHP